MANFCYSCLLETKDEERAKNNDFAGMVRHKERYFCLCDGCGWITVDKNGKKIEDES
jgi:hypothetical protein